MKLNESIRSAFVTSVLQDTPEVDYITQRQKLIQDHLIAAAPAAVVRIYNDRETRRYLSLRHVAYDNRHYSRLGQFWLVPDVDGGYSTYRLTDKDLVAKLQEIDMAAKAQAEQRDALAKKLRTTIYAFNTVKQARDALPEFVKYLPDPEEPKCKTLPAVNDLVADLMKAGWPKKEAEAKAKEQTKKGNKS